jgi:hypothetical protein
MRIKMPRKPAKRHCVKWGIGPKPRGVSSRGQVADLRSVKGQVVDLRIVTKAPPKKKKSRSSKK